MQCCKRKQTADEIEARERSKAIDKVLREDKRKEFKRIKLLLLGAKMPNLKKDKSNISNPFAKLSL
jgi:hypothetical protein